MQIKMPIQVEYIIQQLNKNGFEAYIVGGCVRDSLLDRVPKDWDITTNAEPKQVKSLFDKTIDTGLQHGTVTIMIDKQSYEVTTYRIDGEYSDSRRPDNVVFTTSLKEDLARRDFTINALAYNESEGIIDYFNGICDLNNKLIKCVGKPVERFNEDSLRMLRCIRFSCQLDFNIDYETVKGVSVLKNKINNISKERIRDEVNKILISDKPSYGIKMLYALGLLEYIIPEIMPCINFKQNNCHHNKTVDKHILSVVENTPPILDLRWSALLHDIGKPQTYTEDETGEGHFIGHHKISADMSREILTRLKFDNKMIDKVCVLVYEHMSRYDKLRTPNTKKFINRVGVENLNDLFELQIADIKGCSDEHCDFDNVLKLKEECERILNEKQPLSIKDLNINGYDLIQLGYKEGKDIGNILKELLEAVLENPEMNEKEQLIKLL